jgi:VWFA-related protein
MRVARVLLPALLLFTTVPFAFGSPQQRDTATVEVVQVPVSVTASGAAVRGLTRDDFSVRVNGKPQRIDYFDVIDFAALSSEQLRDPRQRRLYLLVFDLANSSAFSMIRAKRAAEQYLASAQPSDYFAIALLQRHSDVDFIVPFTRDKAALRRAVASFSAASRADPLRLTMAPAERTALINNDSRELAALRRIGGGIAVEMEIDLARTRAANEMDTLGELAERLAPLEGYKHVVLLSEGFESAIINEDRRPVTGDLRDAFGPEMGSLRGSREESVLGFDPRVPGAQMRMQKRFAASGVFLDAVDIAGLRAYDAPSNDALHFLVADTGGRVMQNRNDLTLAMQRLTDSQQIVYMLGFRAPHTGRKENSISVHVSGAPRGSDVGYRESYSSIPDKPSSSDGLRLADIVINDIPQNGITLNAAVATGPRRATVNVAVPTSELRALAANDTTPGAEALIYVFAGQTSVAFAQKTFDPGKSEVTESFELPPGRYAMKVLVRVEGQDTLAFARKDFTIGE